MSSETVLQNASRYEDNQKKFFKNKQTKNMLILIPHAGVYYAGYARNTAFNRVPKTIETICFVSAYHDLRKAIPLSQRFELKDKQIVVGDLSQTDNSFKTIFPELVQAFEHLTE